MVQMYISMLIDIFMRVCGGKYVFALACMSICLCMCKYMFVFLCL